MEVTGLDKWKWWGLPNGSNGACQMKVVGFVKWKWWGLSNGISGA